MSDKSFKQAARESKHRLKAGFWASVREEETSLLCSSPAEVARYLGSKVRRRLLEDTQPESDRLFYLRVEEIIDNEESITNPLRLLTDDAELASLDFAGKQRYLLEISQKYLAVRTQILQERDLERSLALK